MGGTFPTDSNTQNFENYINMEKALAYKLFNLIASAYILSGYQDSNLGPPAPKAGALTGLRYTPKAIVFPKAMQRYNYF